MPTEERVCQLAAAALFPTRPRAIQFGQCRRAVQMQAVGILGPEQIAAIRSEGQPAGGELMLERGHLAAGGEAPEAQRSIAAAAGQSQSIRREGHSLDL